MSADNWAICPRCKIRFDNERAQVQADLKKAYGTVPAEEFLRLSKEAAEDAAKEQEETFREDYAIGLSRSGDGRFVVNYGGSCSECGLEFSYQHEQKIDLSDKSKKVRA